jgi:hypothetical protein
MIRFAQEGEKGGPFITIYRITDGGWAIRVMIGRNHALYFRGRGVSNPNRPRYFLRWQSKG